MESSSPDGNLLKGDSSENNLSNSDVVTKYRTAANIANMTLQKILSEIKTGVSIRSLCKMGDDMLLEETGKIYNRKENGKKVEKGIAFPTCISLNEICDYYSPEDDSVVINDGDVVKITLGCHIDGYIGQVSHTVYNGDTITGRAADAIMGAWVCMEAALREIKVGNTSVNVSKVIEKISAEFRCCPMIGYFSHEMKHHVIEGSRYFSGGTRIEEKTEPFQFGLNEAYSLNIMISTGEGKPKSTELRTTIYRTEVQNRYTLKTTLGRAFISQVNSRFPTFPFHIRSIEDERALKVGLPEALRHSLITPYNVTAEKSGEIVAHFRCTVLLLASGIKKTTGLPFTQKSICKPEYEVKNEKLLKILAAPMNPRVRKGSKGTEETKD